jgi:hypothetical protein
VGLGRVGVVQKGAAWLRRVWRGSVSVRCGSEGAAWLRRVLRGSERCGVARDARGTEGCGMAQGSVSVRRGSEGCGVSRSVCDVTEKGAAWLRQLRVGVL